MSQPAEPQQPDIWTRTDHQIVEFTYRWEVANLSFYLNSTDQEDLPQIKSPTFSPPNDPTLQFALLLYPKGESGDDKGHISLFLELYSCPKPEVRVKCKMSIIDSQNIKQNTKTTTEKFNIAETGWGKVKYISHEAVRGLLTKNKLIIFCEIEVMIDSVDTTIGTRRELNARIEAQVLDNLGELFESRKMSDVVLVAGDSVKTEHRAHRAILAARSSVFGAMFENSWSTESNEGRVLIEDIDGEVIEEMLQFIYTGKVPKLDELADKLLEAADKYALDLLKRLCEQSIIANLNCESVINMLILAEKHCVKQLRLKAIEFINANLSAIFKTDSWKLIQDNAELYFELFAKLLLGNIKK